MMVYQLYLLSFFVGVLIGIIDTWNKKVFFVIWIASIIYCLTTSFGGFNLAEEGISNLHYIVKIPLLLLGYYIGRSAYKDTFGEKK